MKTKRSQVRPPAWAPLKKVSKDDLEGKEWPVTISLKIFTYQSCTIGSSIVDVGCSKALNISHLKEPRNNVYLSSWTMAVNNNVNNNKEQRSFINR